LKEGAVLSGKKTARFYHTIANSPKTVSLIIKSSRIVSPDEGPMPTGFRALIGGNE